MPESSDEQLIEQARRGQPDAFNELVLRYQNYVYSISYRLMGDAASAEDSTQETFLSAYEKLEQFRGGSFKAWLARIATNTCYDVLRTQKRHNITYLDEMPGSEFYDEPPLPADEPTPEQAAGDSDLNRALQDCIQGLADDQRAVLVLCDVMGHSYQEAADAVGTALGTVKSRLSRARQGIRRCLQTVQELLPAEYRLQNED